MKNFFREKENRIVTAVFIITMLVACSPLISRYCINGHDLEYHLLRIESLKEGILMGKPFLKVNTLFFGDAGYASSMFYPDFLLYFPALLRVCGVGINASYHLFAALCFCLCYLAAYFCVKQMTGSRYAGMMAGILLTLCQYHMDDLYIRSAVGEYTALVFLPLVIYGIYNVLYEEMDKPWVLGLGFGGVLLCHTSTFLMCILFGGIAFLIKCKVFCKKPALLGKLFLTAVLTAAATVTYWLPLMEQMLSAEFYVSIPWMKPEDAAVNFAQAFYPVFPALGFLLILFLLPRILIKKDAENKNLLEFADWLTIAGLLFAVFATNLFPWDRLGSYLSIVQFPWRFFLMSSALLAIADALILYCILKHVSKANMAYSGYLEKTMLLAVLFIMAAGALTSLSKNTEGYYDYSDDYYSYKPYTANVIAGEWLPVTVGDKDTIVEYSAHLYTNAGEELEFERIKNTITVRIAEEYEYVDVPFIYYKGYCAYLTGADGTKISLPVTAEGKNGFCRVYTEGRQGTLTVLYDGTFIQGFALGVFIVDVLVLVWLFIRKRKYKTPLKSMVGLLTAGMLTGLCGCQNAIVDSITSFAEGNNTVQTAADSIDSAEETVQTEALDTKGTGELLSGITEKPDKVSGDIFINLSGYETTEKKIAVFRGEKLDAAFEVVDADTGKTVFSGYLIEAMENPKNGETNAKGDFSELDKPGSYYITTENRGRSAAFIIEDGHYRKLLDTRLEKYAAAKAEEIESTEQLNQSMMHTADWLFTYEFLSEPTASSKIPKLITLAKKEIEALSVCQGDDGSIQAGEEAELAQVYRYAAIMAMFAGTYEDFDASYAKECAEAAELSWDYAEDLLSRADMKSDDYEDERYWAAAQLYKLTGKEIYGANTESYIKRRMGLPTGFSDEENGYLGSLAYLKTTYPTNLTLSNQVMQSVFDDAITVINESAKDGYLVDVGDDYGKASVPRAFSNARLLTLANIISKSVDYVDTASSHMDYLYGRNPSAVDYAGKEESDYYNEPETFILTGLLNSYLVQ